MYYIFKLTYEDVLFVLANCRYNEDIFNNFQLENIQVSFFWNFYCSDLEFPFSLFWIAKNEDLGSASANKEEGCWRKNYFFNKVMLDRFVQRVEIQKNLVWKFNIMLHWLFIGGPELEASFQRWHHKIFFSDLNYTCDGLGLVLEKGIFIFENEDIKIIGIFVMESGENARLIWTEKCTFIVLFRNLFSLYWVQGVVGGWEDTIKNTSFQFHAVKDNIIDNATGQFAGFVQGYTAVISKELNSFEGFFDPSCKKMILVTSVLPRASILKVILFAAVVREFSFDQCANFFGFLLLLEAL